MPVLAAALGLLIGGVIGGLGGGGGVLTVPTLVYLLDQAPTDATTGSLIIVGVAAVAGVVARARRGGVDWRCATSFGLVGIPAATLGTLANRSVPEPALLLAFSGLTLAAATAMLLDSRRDPAAPGPTDPPRAHAASSGPGPTAAPASSRAVTAHRSGGRTWPRIALWAPVVGFLTGFLGVGGGFLVVPVLVLALRMPVPRAIGTSLAIITLNAASSVLARTGDLELDWPVIAPFTLAAVAGTLAGKVVADRLSGPLLARAFAVLIGAVGLVVGAHTITFLLT